MKMENFMSNLTETIKGNFIQYAGAVLQNRALINVRDDLNHILSFYTHKYL